MGSHTVGLTKPPYGLTPTPGSTNTHATTMNPCMHAFTHTYIEYAHKQPCTHAHTYPCILTYVTHISMHTVIHIDMHAHTVVARAMKPTEPIL
jgi:hypothetical protein